MTFHRKVARTKDEFRRISFALLLHNTVTLSSLCKDDQKAAIRNFTDSQHTLHESQQQASRTASSMSGCEIEGQNHVVAFRGRS